MYPTYDANGNIGQLINADANVVAAYTYDPFGNVTEMAGAEAAKNPWRFSTKPVEAGTGWLYYGYRWYDAETGRWVNRDPIEESGGVNLYGFVGNDGLNTADFLGLSEMVKRGVEIKWAITGAASVGGDNTLFVGIEADVNSDPCKCEFSGAPRETRTPTDRVFWSGQLVREAGPTFYRGDDDCDCYVYKYTYKWTSGPAGLFSTTFRKINFGGLLVWYMESAVEIEICADGTVSGSHVPAQSTKDYSSTEKWL